MWELCKVTESLFISNARSACNTDLLLQEVVTQCINVSRQQPFPLAMVTQIRVSVFDEPNEDLYAHFDSCADAIEAEARRGGKTLVYCKNGRSRSAAVCAAYLLKYQQLTVESALQVRGTLNQDQKRTELQRNLTKRIPGLNQYQDSNKTKPRLTQKVKSARHVIEPNPGFMSQLQRYEEELRWRRDQG